MDDIFWFSDRVAMLRLQKGVSAREMSLSLGQSESYINKIENKRTLPSMTGFLYICEYFGITPQQFFDVENSSPSTTQQLIEELSKLTAEQSEHVLAIIRDMNRK